MELPLRPGEWRLCWQWRKNAVVLAVQWQWTCQLGAQNWGKKKVIGLLACWRLTIFWVLSRSFAPNPAGGAQCASPWPPPMWWLISFLSKNRLYSRPFGFRSSDFCPWTLAGGAPNLLSNQGFTEHRYCVVLCDVGRWWNLKSRVFLCVCLSLWARWFVQ